MDPAAALTHLIGFAASTTAFVLWLPQARRTWTLRNDPAALSGISLGTQWLVITNSMLWFAYGWLEQAFWIAAPGFINVPLASATVYLVMRARRVGRPRLQHLPPATGGEPGPENTLSPADPVSPAGPVSPASPVSPAGPAPGASLPR